MLKILMIGDIVSSVGRNMLAKYLSSLKSKYEIDFVIANGENVVHGKGINKEMYNKLISFGVDAITLGNHAYRKDTKAELFDSPSLIRPYNIHKTAPGIGSRTFSINGIQIRVSNLLGQVFMGELNPTNPFDALEEIINSSSEKVHIVDFHAQATGEKLALAWAFDGKVTAFLGTHTHVQTADERILPNGSGYISDVGMCGAYNSVIGSRPNEVIYRSWTGLPSNFEVALGDGQLNAVVLTIDETTGHTLAIERINITPSNPN